MNNQENTHRASTRPDLSADVQEFVLIVAKLEARYPRVAEHLLLRLVAALSDSEAERPGG